MTNQQPIRWSQLSITTKRRILVLLLVSLAYSFALTIAYVVIRIISTETWIVLILAGSIVFTFIYMLRIVPMIKEDLKSPSQQSRKLGGEE